MAQFVNSKIRNLSDEVVGTDVTALNPDTGNYENMACLLFAIADRDKKTLLVNQKIF